MSIVFLCVAVQNHSGRSQRMLTSIRMDVMSATRSEADFVTGISFLVFFSLQMKNSLSCENYFTRS